MKKKSLQMVGLLLYFVSGILLISAKEISTPSGKLHSSNNQSIPEGLINTSLQKTTIKSFKNHTYKRLAERMCNNR